MKKYKLVSLITCFFLLVSNNVFAWDVNKYLPLGGTSSHYLRGDNTWQTITSISNATHTGDATGATALTVVGINGTIMSGLATGILKNTTTTGVPSVAVAGDFPTLNQNSTGTSGGLTGTPAISVSSVANSGGYTQTGTSANAFTGTPTFSNATYSALFTGGNAGVGTILPIFLFDILSGTANTGVNSNNPSQFEVTGPDKTLVSGGATVFINSNSAHAADTGGSLVFTGRNTDSSTNSLAWAVLKGAKENMTSGNGNGYFAIATQNHNAGAFVERFRIDSSGNFGIGTSTPSAQTHTTGTVRFQNFGAGAATFDANGNISSASDERLKTIIGNFDKGLAEILKINPILHKWNKESGLEMNNIYAEFSAQNVAKYIPEAVFTNEKGYLSIFDRTLTAALVNSVKSLQAEIDTLRKTHRYQKYLLIFSLFALSLSQAILWKNKK